MRLEFRIPISPTPGFFSQIRFFNAALRRLGGIYGEALLMVVVGDRCDLDAVRRANAWAEAFPVRFVRVPDDVAETYGMHGTADFRYVPETAADVVILSDADSVLVRDVDALVDMLCEPEAAIAGHMAHYPPPIAVADTIEVAPASFWPQLFAEFDIPFPVELYRYSIDPADALPPVPAYYNLGFVALNAGALDIFRREIFACQTALRERTTSFMWCQIACTLVAYRYGVRVNVLGAEYNAANDERHFAHNALSAEAIRVVHYLRTNEIDRSTIFLPERLDEFLTTAFSDPVNRLLQCVARDVASDLADERR